MRHSSVAHLIRNRRVACQARGEAVEIEREIVFPASPEEVWEALTEPERLEEWFATEVELDARPGGEGIFRWGDGDRKSTRLNSSHSQISYAVFCLKKKENVQQPGMLAELA